MNLAELTGMSAWHVNDYLRTVSGRSFACRDNDQQPEVYQFGHQELRVTALDMLQAELGQYRELLHNWADGYRAKGWPSGTPDYLFHGYYEMLRSLG